MNDPNHWIKSLQMQQHPEGGWFREDYRSAELIPHEALPDRFTGDRAFSTAIYYLLKQTDVSALHRIRQDEVWHFYEGSSLTIHIIEPDGNYSAAKLGTDLQAGERPMVVVRAGCIFGATVDDTESFSLIGCTVAPGFDFDDFELPSRKRLLEQFPQHKQIIEMLARPT